MKRGYNLPCNIAQVLNLIGDRWTLLIIRDLVEGKSMFNELKQSLEGISANILSDRLRFLEREQLITCHLYSDHPPRYEYKLSEAGQQLCHVLNAISLWGQQHLDKAYTKIVHAECNHEVELLYHCSHCQKSVDALSIKALENDELDF